jgi:hypothetical protein
MRFSAVRCAVGAALFACTGSAHAGDLFSITVTSEGVTAVETFSSASTLFDVLDNNVFRKQLGDVYTNTSLATATADFRGLPFLIEYRDDSTTLYFTIPELGVEESFTGATRKESEDQFIDYFESNGDGINRKITRYTVAETSSDPVAGNPNSLVARTAADDFEAGTSMGGSLPTVDGSQTNFAFGARFGQFTVDDQKTNVYSAPLRTSFKLGDSGLALLLDAPLTVVEIENAYSYGGSLGLGLRVPVTSFWSLTPAIRAGVVGSEDLAALATVYSGSLTSSLRFHIGETALNIGNAVTRTATGSAKVDGYEIDYDIKNVISRNGVEVSHPLSTAIASRRIDLEFAAVNTRFFGDAIYIEQYTDLAVSLGFRRSEGDLLYNFARVGLTYSFGDEGYSGVTVNFGYQF